MKNYLYEKNYVQWNAMQSGLLEIVTGNSIVINEYSSVPLSIYSFQYAN